MLTIAFVTSALALLACASPTYSPVQDRGVKIALSKRSALSLDDVINVNAILASLERTISKYETGFAAYETNTGDAHPLSILPDSDDPDDGGSNGNTTGRAGNSLRRRASSSPPKGTVPLTDDNHGELWQGTLTVGTPPRPFTVQFDTGSSDLFVPGPTCSPNCQGHARFNPANSTTAVDAKKPFTLTYGSGQVQGEQYTDTVGISGYTAKQQRLGVANAYSSSFGISNFPPDGLMGMAYQSISVYNSPPVFQSLVAQKQVTAPVFSFKLAPTGAELFLGGTDSSLYKGNFTYVPVTTQGYWQVALDAVSINSTTVAPLRNLQSVIDTGTTYIVAPTSQVNKFYASIPGSKDQSSTVGTGFHSIPCAATEHVALSFGNTSFGIAPSLFNLGRVSQGSSDCLGAVIGSDGVSFWVVGDTFLQNVYSTFDLGNNRVGFAALK